jgi:type IV secretion system protein VirB9
MLRKLEMTMRPRPPRRLTGGSVVAGAARFGNLFRLIAAAGALAVTWPGAALGAPGVTEASGAPRLAAEPAAAASTQVPVRDCVTERFALVAPDFNCSPDSLAPITSADPLGLPVAAASFAVQAPPATLTGCGGADSSEPGEPAPAGAEGASALKSGLAVGNVGLESSASATISPRVFGLFSSALSPTFPADSPALTLLAARGAAAAAPASAPSQQATATPPATLPTTVPVAAASTAPDVTTAAAGGSATTAAPAESAANVPESGPHTAPHRSAAAAAPPPAPASQSGSAAPEPPPALSPVTPPDLDPESLARSYQRTGSAPTVEIAGHGGGTVALVAFGHGRPLLRCAPLRACAVELEPGELVLATSLGDAERWLVQSAASGPGARTPLLVVKPTACDLSTNLVIATDRRIYEMALDSPPCHGADGGEGGYNPHLPYTGLVRFYYPDELVRRWRDEERMAREMEAERAAGRVPLAPTARLARLNFDYAWDRGRKLPWAPTQVFDDGEHTYLVLGASAPLADLPVLMAVDGDGSLALVSYHLEGQTLVADRVLEHAVLMVGPAGHGRGKDQQRLDITNRSFNRRPAEGGGR